MIMATNQTEKTGNGSKKYQLNRADMKEVGKGALLAILGVLLAYLTQVSTQIDFGVYTPFVSGLFFSLLNLCRVWLTDYSKKE